MKKNIRLILFCGVMFLLTGCVKYNVTMDIKKDKSMDFTLIYALNSSLLEDDSLLKDEDKRSFQDAGFIVEDYSENNMRGVKIYKSIKNIDAVSSVVDANYSLSALLDNQEKDESMFKVKKGLFKNTYIAKLKFDASDSELSNSDIDGSSDVDDYSFDEEEETDISTSDADISSDVDYSSMMSSMDLSFNVKLPYSAKSSNATIKNNDNKDLSWTLSSSGEESIDFEFELYNWNTIYIICGAGIVLIVIIIVIMINGKKKKDGNSDIVAQSDDVSANAVMQNAVVDGTTTSITEISQTVESSPTTPAVEVPQTVESTPTTPTVVVPQTVESAPATPAVEVPQLGVDDFETSKVQDIENDTNNSM